MFLPYYALFSSKWRYCTQKSQNGFYKGQVIVQFPAEIYNIKDNAVFAWSCQANATNMLDIKQNHMNCPNVLFPPFFHRKIYLIPTYTIFDSIIALNVNFYYHITYCKYLYHW